MHVYFAIKISGSNVNFIYLYLMLSGNIHADINQPQTANFTVRFTVIRITCEHILYFYFSGTFSDCRDKIISYKAVYSLCLQGRTKMLQFVQLDIQI